MIIINMNHDNTGTLLEILNFFLQIQVAPEASGAPPCSAGGVRAAVCVLSRRGPGAQLDGGARPCVRLNGAREIPRRSAEPHAETQGTDGIRPPSSQGMTDLFHLPQELQAEVTAHKMHLNLILEKGRSLAPEKGRSLVQTGKSQAEEVLRR